MRGPESEGGYARGDGRPGQGRQAPGVPEGEGDHPRERALDGRVGFDNANDEKSEKGITGKIRGCHKRVVLGIGQREVKIKIK